jgi:hypothetical protein
MSKVSTSPQVSTPKRILATLQAYRDAAALNTAIELELFTRIAHGCDTASKIAGEIGIPARGVRLLCEYLAAIGLLEKEDEQLKLPADVALFLDRKSTAYLSHAIQTLHTPALLRSYERLTEAVRSGLGVEPGAAKVVSLPPWLEVASGITDQTAAAKAFADAVNLANGRPLKILDVGSQDGAFGIALAERYADSVIVALNSAAALPAAEENADVAKLGTRYQNIPGDPLQAPLGWDYDAVLMARSLYQFDQSQATSLLMRIQHALKKTGHLLILEFLSEEDSEFLREFSGVRLNLLAATPRGDAYSKADLKGMIEASGYHDVETREIRAARATLFIARP